MKLRGSEAYQRRAEQRQLRILVALIPFENPSILYTSPELWRMCFVCGCECCEWGMWEKKTRSHFYEAAIKIFTRFILNQNWTIFFWIFSIILLSAKVPPCVFGRFSQQHEKLLNSHNVLSFSLSCSCPFSVHDVDMTMMTQLAMRITILRTFAILIECSPGIRADSACEQTTSDCLVYIDSSMRYARLMLMGNSYALKKTWKVEWMAKVTKRT